MKITNGKLQLMEKLTNTQGIVAALAIDQRGSLKKMLSEAFGREVKKAEIERFKELVVRELGKYASAFLIDLEYGHPTIAGKNDDIGVLLSYEKTGYDTTNEYRLPDLIEDLSVRRIKEAGGDAVKVLLYYNPDEPAEILELKHAFIERIGTECLAEDIPFFLEPIGYDAHIKDEKGLAYAKIKPEKVFAAIREFSKDQYHVDILKLEVPINLSYIKEYAINPDEVAYTKAEAVEYFQEAGKLAKKPFIYLSAGVTTEQFRQTLALANEAHVPYSGVLCGRATWKDAVAIYGKQGEEALLHWLDTTGKANMETINELLAQGAKDWRDIYGGVEAIEKTELNIAQI